MIKKTVTVLSVAALAAGTAVLPAAASDMKSDMPAHSTSANPCAGKANPCAAKANPCSAKSNPCSAKANPCAAKKQMKDSKGMKDSMGKKDMKKM